MESGERFITDIELVYLARVLGASYDDLLGEVNQEEVDGEHVLENQQKYVPEGRIDLTLVENSCTVLREVLQNYQHYLQALELSERDQKIIKAFLDGERYKNLADQYGLRPSTIRTIIVRFKMKVSKMERKQKTD